MEDTIAAISTSLGVGAISIIRVSGNESIDIVNKIFKGKNLKEVESHTINYGHIINNDLIVDEVLVSIMKAPKTFTKEDIVEINCHGGIATTKKVLELLLNNGCRLAEPGEFTKRAFLNGRIDLVEAEGIMDLIESKTEKSRQLAINQVDGKVSNLIKNLRREIIEILANIEVNIDYPEYEDIEVLTNEKIIPKINMIEDKIKHIIKESENGKLIKNGINTAIIGKPNVGKSSILNRLLNYEKAIVTDIAGTTRDIVEGEISIDGIILNIIDTAGIRKTDDIVEKIGVEKSINLIKEADLVLYVLNNNEAFDETDSELISKLKDKNHIIIINKNDLDDVLDRSKIDSNNVISINTVNEDSIDVLKDKIKEMFNFEKLETEDLTYLTNARSLSILNKCLSSIEDVKRGINDNMPIDLVGIDIKNIWNLLGEIIGETYQEELIDQLFSQFCLGK